ncbi:MAG TPA: PIN domain-containing protein [Rhizomicrobium sp.]|nr:PIN domain-containing protein [Rhizomicrobium sp.]
MIAVDTSALSAFLKGEPGKGSDRLALALQAGDLRLPPVVITEILSDPLASSVLADLLSQAELLEIQDGYWQRAGDLRRLVKIKGHKAKTADALVAQSCIDHQVALITHDADFRHFVRYGGLKLA